MHRAVKTQECHAMIPHIISKSRVNNVVSSQSMSCLRKLYPHASKNTKGASYTSTFLRESLMAKTSQVTSVTSPTSAQQ